MRKLCVYALFAIVAVAVFASVWSFGQVTGTGTIEGTGWIRLGLSSWRQVTIMAVDRFFPGQKQQKEGLFTFASVKPGGDYVSVTMKGFERWRRRGRTSGRRPAQPQSEPGGGCREPDRGSDVHPRGGSANAQLHHELERGRQ